VRLTTEECEISVLQDKRWPREARYLKLEESAVMLRNMASYVEFYLTAQARIIFVPPLIPTEMEWYGPGRLRRDTERSEAYATTTINLAKRIQCEVVEIPWPDGSKEHQNGVSLTTKGGEELEKAVTDKVLRT
jgi:hypothetical protein